MKKLIMFLCILIMFFGIVGCPDDNNDPAPKVTTSSVVIKPEVGGSSPVPEPATLFLLGSGLVGIAVIGRKRFKK